MRSEFLIPLKDASDITLVGGKAASLGTLLRNGFDTPDGFVVTVVVAGNMTPALEDEILAAFDKLNTPYVAVRSSGTGEDSEDATWAGQLDTVLNVTRDNLIEAVKKCWGSTKSDRAVAYAKERSLNVGEIAVIVQAMIECDLSGAAFSAHPVTQDTSQVVVEAGYGLGEAILSGQVTPDTYFVDKSSGKIIKKHISAQDKKLVQDGSGKNVWQKVSEPADQQKLTDEQIEELAKAVTKVEEIYKKPADIEWAIKDGKVYLLQSRPITTLK
jgi:phosphoenolpyruvate synthase/pyruvate phosphate dikinase